MRDLFEKITDYRGDDLYHELLLPWIDQQHYAQQLVEIAQLMTDRQPLSALPIQVPVEVSWQLYALSRVLDLLTLGFQPATDSSSNQRYPVISRQHYIAFAEQIGLTVKSIDTFHPFYCEILSAESSTENFSLNNVAYPPLMLGQLLIHRGGVVIGVKPTEYNIDLINQAQIYWAYRRRNRPAQDLSHGWGSNSQWRTRFRFDFANPTGFVYNAEGEFDLTAPTRTVLQELAEDGMSLAEARELVVYRQFVTCGKEDGDLFPYRYRYKDLVSH